MNATTSLARQAVRLYPRTSYTERRAVNVLRRGWVAQIIYLGPRWLLHPDNQVQRKQAGSADAWVLVGTVILGFIGLMLPWAR